MSLRAAGSACLAALLGACATPGPVRTYFQEDAYARYYVSDTGKTLRVERDGTVLDISCLPVEAAQDKPLNALPRQLCAGSEIPVLGKARRAGDDWDLSDFAVEPATGRCLPLFRNPSYDEREAGPRRSCWNRVWEVPAALIAVPAAVLVVAGVATAPIWAPLLFLR
ncbi:MAG: hypothetical protein KGJ84_17175 [Elusimicrobia bacterium]|nr:hypothetical protein [Elusimicrobiota bacterium]